MVSKAEEEQLNRLENQVDNGGGGAWEYLCLLRKLKLRRSDKVLKHGVPILNDHKKRSALGPEESSVMGEFQVLIKRHQEYKTAAEKRQQALFDKLEEISQCLSAMLLNQLDQSEDYTNQHGTTDQHSLDNEATSMTISMYLAIQNLISTRCNIQSDPSGLFSRWKQIFDTNAHRRKRRKNNIHISCLRTNTISKGEVMLWVTKLIASPTKIE